MLQIAAAVDWVVNDTCEKLFFYDRRQMQKLNDYIMYIYIDIELLYILCTVCSSFQKYCIVVYCT